MEFTSRNITIRFFEDADAAAMLDLDVRNKEFFQKYSPTHEDSYYTLESKARYIEESAKKREAGSQYCFGIFLNGSGELIGGVNLFQIIRGPLQSCMIGYSLDQRHNGKGYTTEAVTLAVQFAFEELKLHRIEAGVMPANIGSMRVLEKAGFHKEGVARKNVQINGRWEDHQVLAILSVTD